MALQIPTNSFSSDPFLAQRQLISHLPKNDLVIFDIGANRGQTAQRYRTEFPHAQIYCFEPFPDAVEDLQQLLADDPQAHIIPKAVAQAEGASCFYVNEYDATNSLLPRPALDRRYYPTWAGPKEEITVTTISLDEFVKANQIPQVDILKLDIQGGELNALKGAQALLHTQTVSLIYTEIMFVPHYENSPLFHELWAYLSRSGYSLFDVYDLHRATNGQLRYGDALFVSDAVRQTVLNRFPAEP